MQALNNWLNKSSMEIWLQQLLMLESSAMVKITAKAAEGENQG